MKKPTTHGGPRPGSGRPSGEKTKQIRIYAADVPKLKRHGKTQAEAVRKLVQAGEVARLLARSGP
jgi:hypothetical protein